MTVTLILKVTKDPELKYSAKGTAWTRINCVYKPWKKDVPYMERPSEWVSVSVFGEAAEHVCETVHKGYDMIVKGRLEINEWEKDGETNTGLSIIAENIGPDLSYASYEKVQVERQQQDEIYDDDEEPF